MARKKKNLDATIIAAIGGDEDIANSRIRIENDYLDRERRENLLFQGYDVTQHGFEAPEKTYSYKERLIRQSDKDMEECEAKRANRDPFDTPHLEPVDMEEYMDLVRKDTDLRFIESREIDLVNAKIRRTYSQYIPKEFVSETVNLEIWNKDMEERYTFKISSRFPMVMNHGYGNKPEQPEDTIGKGSIKITRNKERTRVTLYLHGENGDASLTYTTKGLIWVAEVVDKKEPTIEEIGFHL